MKSIAFFCVGLISAIIIAFSLLEHKNKLKLTKFKYSLCICLFSVINAFLWFLCSDMDNNIVFNVISAVLLTVLLLVSAFDIKYKLIPRPMMITVSVLSVILVISDSFLAWYYHILGGFSVFLIFFLMRLVATNIEKQEALGMADIVLAAAMGLVLGVWKILLASLIASFTGIIVIIVCKALKAYGRQHEYAFSPMLAVGFAVSLIYGNNIINFYLSLLGK